METRREAAAAAALALLALLGIALAQQEPEGWRDPSTRAEWTRQR